MRGVQARRPSIYDLEERLRTMNVPTLTVSGGSLVMEMGIGQADALRKAVENDELVAS